MSDLFTQKADRWDNPIKIEMAANFIAYLKQNVQLPSKPTLIEFGCGTGLVGLQLAATVAHITLIDSSPSMLGKLQEKLIEKPQANVRVMQGELDSYVGEPVDAIVGFMVLHHIEQTDKLLRDALCRLKEGGLLAIGDLVEEDGTFHRDELVPHNGFNLMELVRLTEDQGFGRVTIQEYGKVSKGSRQYPLFAMVAYK